MICAELERAFIGGLSKLPYANPTSGAKSYGGWVKDFHIHKKGEKDNASLALTKENDADLFLLFVLAIVWSRRCPWENSAFFVAYLKLCRGLTTWSEVERWVSDELRPAVTQGKTGALSERYAREERENLWLDSGIPTNNGAREEISLRKDALNSVLILFDEWFDKKERAGIKSKLQESEDARGFKGDYMIFVNHMRSINGLGSPRGGGAPGKMSMKILLILRELRIQSCYANIPGSLCCVPDARVIKAAKNITDLTLYGGRFTDHLRSSERIYKKFGDWYDVPLFAHKDLRLLGLI